MAPAMLVAVGEEHDLRFAQCFLESKRCEGVTIPTNSIPVAQLAHSADASALLK